MEKQNAFARLIFSVSDTWLHMIYGTDKQPTKVGETQSKDLRVLHTQDARHEATRWECKSRTHEVNSGSGVLPPQFGRHPLAS